jgi:hypothetical protein
VDGPSSALLRFAPPVGTRVACPAVYRQTAWVRDPFRPTYWTLGGERLDAEEVIAIDGGRRAVRRSYGGMAWTIADPRFVPGATELPPVERTGVVDEAGKVVDGAIDPSPAAVLGDFLWQFRSTAGFPEEALAPGATFRRDIRWFGPPGTATLLVGTLEGRLDGFAAISGRTCARLEVRISGDLLPAAKVAAGEEAIPALAASGTGRTCIDLETGMALGAVHDLRYSMSPAGTPAGSSIELVASFRQGPCTIELP